MCSWVRLNRPHFCERLDAHPYELFLAVNDIDHAKTKVKSPQTNGICERFHTTVLQEFYQVTFRTKLYSTVEELQADLDAWLIEYDEHRTHQGKMCCGRTPLETFDDGIKIWGACLGGCWSRGQRALWRSSIMSP